MNRSELVNLIKEQSSDLDSQEVENAVQLFFNEIISSLTAGSRIELRGFGSFSIKIRAPRIARNPRTGEKFFPLRADTSVFERGNASIGMSGDPW